MVDIVTILEDTDIHYGDDNRALVEMQGGGAAANVTAWLAVAGHRPTLYCAVGDDVIGHALVEDLERCGAIVRATRTEQPTGAVVALVHPNGERTMFPSATANFGLPATVLDAALLPHDHLHVSGYLLLREHTRAAALQYVSTARAVGASVSIDPASARLIEVMGASAALGTMRGADLLIANELEAMALTGTQTHEEAARRLADDFPTAIVKLGSHGACVWSEGELITVPAIPSDVVDTVGAGDAFAAGAIPAWKHGEPLQTVLEAGNAYGHLAVEQRGARPRR